MSPSETEKQCKNIAQKFGELRQFPHVLGAYLTFLVGAIDGKHVIIEVPPKSATLYQNQKGTFSIALLAICVAKYNFILVGVGQHGSNNDTRVLAQTKISSAFENNTLNLPESEVPGTNLDIPYFLAGDEIFLLKP